MLKAQVEADDTQKVSDEVRTRQPGIMDQIDVRRLMAIQSPKWGTEAARFRWKRQQDGRLLAVCIAILYLVGVFGDVHKPVTIALLVGLAGLGVLIGLRTAKWWQRMNLAASKSLGVDISWKPGHAPPRKPQAYEKWCEKNRLTPYSAL